MRCRVVVILVKQGRFLAVQRANTTLIPILGVLRTIIVISCSAIYHKRFIYIYMWLEI